MVSLRSRRERTIGSANRCFNARCCRLWYQTVLQHPCLHITYVGHSVYLRVVVEQGHLAAGARIAKYGNGKIRELLGNAGIIRNRAKVSAAVNNAGKFLEIQEQFGSFDAYIWGFIDNKPIVTERRKLEDYPAKSPESELISKDLQKRGFSFVGPTIIYAHMQATGMVNDHSINCYRRDEIISLTRRSGD